MSPNPVRVLDRVVLPADQVDPWLTRWRTDYLPGATARGLREPHIWREFHNPDAIALQIIWELPGIYDFYGMRGMAAADPTVTRFWADTDAIAVSRERHIMQEETP